MAISHVCMGCGWDLARVRPAADPHYGLPLIICPRCAKTTTRSQHPLWVAFRKFQQLDLTITVLGLQLAMAGLLVIFTPFGALAMVVGVSGPQRSAIDSDLWWYFFWPLGVMGPITGAWLTAGFPHLVRWRVFLGWYAILCTVAWFGWLWAAAQGGVRWQSMALPIEPRHWPVLVLALFGFLTHIIMMGAVMVTAIAGIPLGWGVQRVIANFRTALWRRRRRRVRLRSSA